MHVCGICWKPTANVLKIPKNSQSDVARLDRLEDSLRDVMESLMSLVDKQDN